MLAVGLIWMIRSTTCSLVSRPMDGVELASGNSPFGAPSVGAVGAASTVCVSVWHAACVRVVGEPGELPRCAEKHYRTLVNWCASV